MGRTIHGRPGPEAAAAGRLLSVCVSTFGAKSERVKERKSDIRAVGRVTRPIVTEKNQQPIREGVRKRSCLEWLTCFFSQYILVRSKKQERQIRSVVPVSVSTSSLFRHPSRHSFTLSLFVFLSLFSCSDDARQSTRIHEVPQVGDSSRVEGALRALTNAINQSAPASAYAKRAVILLDMGRVNDALEDIDEAISREPNIGTYYLTRARVLRALQQSAKALENAQRAEILGVDTPELYTLQGDLLQQQRQFDRAQLYVARALQMAPYDGEAYFFKGLMAAKLGDTTQALALYKHSLQLKPRYLDTYSQLASVYRALKDPYSSLVYNEQAIRYFPNNARLHYSRGVTYHVAGRLDSAVACYQQAVKLQPNYYQAFFQIGLINQAYRNYPNALANYQRVQQLRPQFPRIDTYLGYCYEQTGQYDLAIAAYDKALKLDANDKLAYQGSWRAQRRQYTRNSYNPLLLPDASTEAAAAGRGRQVLDTTRVRISTLQPKTTNSSGGSDSLRRTIKPIN
ncbi:tetratricopeptide repeat protein [Spirosoma sp. KUDC1026]|nr:tetratricopeptide repeat protein [Spirosoma sp. KUDC1026]